MAEDFAVIETLGGSPSIDSGALAQHICNRRGPIGAAGAVFVESSPGSGAVCRFFRPNGTEIALSLSGLRCAARHVAGITGQETVTLAATTGTFQVEPVSGPAREVKWYRTSPVRIATGDESPYFGRLAQSAWGSAIPALGPLSMYGVDVGEPHLVTFPAHPMTTVELEAIGKAANEASDIFPGGINVSAAFCLTPSEIFVRTFGRHTQGLSPSRSSGMLAAAFVASKRGMAATEVAVLSSRGRAECRLHRDYGEISTNCSAVYTAELQISPEGGLRGPAVIGEACVDEILAYREFERQSHFNAVERRYFD